MYLSEEMVLHILECVSLERLLWIRLCSRKFRDLVRQDPRWLPIVAPPTLTHATLSLEAHGTIMIRLYVRYLHWLWRWASLKMEEDDGALRAQTTALDGFFALGPWTRGGETRWLQPVVYAPQRRDERRRSPRRPPKLLDDAPSAFHQQRERDDYDEDMLRTFYSVPVGMSDVVASRKPLARRWVVQPLNVRSLDGTADPRLPDLSRTSENALHTVATPVLACYLEGVEIAPTQRFKIDTSSLVDRDLQGAVTSDGTPVHQVLVRAFQSYQPIETAGAFASLVVAPHLRPANTTKYSLAWVFSSPVVARRRKSDLVPWCISTHQIEAYLDHSEPLRARVLAAMILHCVLSNGIGLDQCCESDPCALNNCDSVGESASISLLLCPCCLRKLQLLGIIRDVRACLAAMRRVLSSPALRGVSARDLEILDKWGVRDKDKDNDSGEDPGSAAAPSPLVVFDEPPHRTETSTPTSRWV
ncbi:hypothetical protein CTAYLR_006088 [Chrysophaeum taylorii]|uniref:F-box domain-containing protein n=1 Tax=Chrysophaeum taylorii TaxID=2483200 RepID=A0AAD7XGP7_9STRA|nr:hypothetical protein CTAYLR_006088 [Chrysophaeum taylorii]